MKRNSYSYRFVQADSFSDILVCNCFISVSPQANSSMLVNSVQVPESDIMATNGVVHFVNQVLYPGGKTFTTFLISPHFVCKQEMRRVAFEVNALCFLFPDIPVGSQDFLMLLKRLVTYMQIKVLYKQINCCRKSWETYKRQGWCFWLSKESTAAFRDALKSGYFPGIVQRGWIRLLRTFLTVRWTNVRIHQEKICKFHRND